VKANAYRQVVFATNRYCGPHTDAGKKLVLRAFPEKHRYQSPALFWTRAGQLAMMGAL
jgi:hypothetical protein